jgi:hypothetical protein
MIYETYIWKDRDREMMKTKDEVRDDKRETVRTIVRVCVQKEWWRVYMRARACYAALGVGGSVKLL